MTHLLCRRVTIGADSDDLAPNLAHLILSILSAAFLTPFPKALALTLWLRRYNGIRLGISERRTAVDNGLSDDLSRLAAPFVFEPSLGQAPIVCSHGPYPRRRFRLRKLESGGQDEC